MKKLLILLGVVVPSVALLWFGLSRDPRALPSALVGKNAPDFELITIDGERISLGSLRGRPMILNFWATWCETCGMEHQLIREAREFYEPQGVRFYSVLYADTAENAQAFIEKYGKAAPILLDPDLRTSIDYGVTGVPETFFIDAKGTILYKEAGPLTPELIGEKMKLLLDGPAAGVGR
jgi:cytochrome c biogenesis protein CcmG, thiol:disulfide interchange protein DsbE